jgi:hypothetical protein
VRLLRRSYGGTLASSGLVLIGKIFTRSFGGTLHPTGVVGFARTLYRAWGGVLAPSGVFSYRQLQRVFVSFDGYLRSWGEVRLELRKGYWPPVSPSDKPSAPSLAVSSSSAAPLLMLVQGSLPPAVEPSVKPAAPYAVPQSKPDWPPLHANPR